MESSHRTTNSILFVSVLLTLLFVNCAARHHHHRGSESDSDETKSSGHHHHGSESDNSDETKSHDHHHHHKSESDSDETKSRHHHNHHHGSESDNSDETKSHDHHHHKSESDSDETKSRHHHGSESDSDETAISSGPLPESESDSVETKRMRSDLGLFFNPSISRICHSTDYADVCFSSLSPFLKGREGTSDVPSVLRFAIRAALDKTKRALDEVDRLESDEESDKGLKSVLSDCKDSYNDAIDNFQSALDALPSRDVGTMNSMLSASITDFGDCDDFLDGYEVSLPGINRDLTHMTSNCLAITSLLN